MSAPDFSALTEPRHGHLQGRPCPPFAVRDVHGADLTGADLRGAPALVIFFPFAFTPICEGELADLNDNIRRFDDVAILAISCDGPAALGAWQAAEDFAFDLASDFWPHGRAARSFGVFDDATGHPRRATFALDARGTIAWSVVNPPGQARSVDEYAAALAQLPPTRRKPA